MKQKPKFLMSFSSTESSSADAELLGLQNTRVLESLLALVARWLAFSLQRLTSSYRYVKEKVILLATQVDSK
jgi:hypothetical protein